MFTPCRARKKRTIEDSIQDSEEEETGGNESKRPRSHIPRPVDLDTVPAATNGRCLQDDDEGTTVAHVAEVPNPPQTSSAVESNAADAAVTS